MTLPNIDELIENLSFHGRYARETEQRASERRYYERIEAAAALSTLQEQKRKLEEALKPFAKEAERADLNGWDLRVLYAPIDAFRRARALLSGGGE